MNAAQHIKPSPRHVTIAAKDCLGWAMLTEAMKQDGLSQSALTVLADDVTRELGKRTTIHEVNHVVAGRRRATNLLAVALEDVLGIPVRAWFEPAP